jgi:hypothetical protein
MRMITAASLLMLSVTPVLAAGSGKSSVPSTNTGPGSASFNSYRQSHAGLSQFNPPPKPVSGTGPGSASFNSYLQSHAGLAQYNTPGPTMPTMPTMPTR